jgi:hypothetical protein
VPAADMGVALSGVAGSRAIGTDAECGTANGSTLLTSPRPGIPNGIEPSLLGVLGGICAPRGVGKPFMSPIPCEPAAPIMVPAPGVPTEGWRIIIGG